MPTTGPACWLTSVVDAVVDACDQVRAKVAMAVWARQNPAIAFIAAGAAGGKRLAHKVDIEDLSACTHDPLLASVRNRLRKDHGAPREGQKMRCLLRFQPRGGGAARCASCALESGGRRIAQLPRLWFGGA
jgi:tRNA A37 threonylcarbamoyladenosine dehydratase